MVILTEYELVEKPPRGFFVVSHEKSICPCCNGALECVGSRTRICLNEASDKRKLIIRRLRCGKCVRIHHELPDMLIPYKRYDSRSIEAVIDGKAELTVAADESTIRRWREWFRGIVEYLAGCLESAAARFGIGVAAKPKNGGYGPVERIKRQAGAEEGWMARAVRTATNMNLWVHTRSAFQAVG
jgi:hypothetical protein